MPLYTYNCLTHGGFDVYCISYAKRQAIEPCPKCKVASNLGAQLPAMQPDNMWAGQYVESVDKYFTSKSDFKQYLKDNKLAITEPGIVKQKSVTERAMDSLNKPEAVKKRHEIVASTVQQMTA